MGEEQNVYKCRNCGGEVRFDVRAQKFLCTACRAEYTPQDAQGIVEEKAFDAQKLQVSDAQLAGVKTAVCGSCGAEIFFAANETASRCPMCGAAQLREEAGKTLVRPDGIVPFKVDAQDAQEGFRKFVSKRFFAPNALKSAYEEGKLEGWYIPFWTFDADARATYTGEGGQDYKVKKNGQEVTETHWTPVHGIVSHSFDDVLVCATNSNSRKMVENIDAYDTSESAVRPYSAQYLQGYLAEYRSIEAGPAFEAAKTVMESELESEASSEVRRTYTSDRNLRVQAQYSGITCKSLLLPIYRASYSFKGKLYDYIINGQSGKVSAKYPKSAVKIILTILLIAAIIAGIVLLVKLH